MAQQPTGYAWPPTGELPAAPEPPSRPLVAYVHVPFCTVRCGYCDFNTYTAQFGPGADLGSYDESVIREVVLAGGVLAAGWTRPLASVFFGGGTPSLLQPAAIGRVLDALAEVIGLEDGAEVTLETNPDTLDASRAEAFAEAGINRFSIGMQSAVPSVLATLDRTHDPRNIEVAVEAAKAAGARVSVDLIYGAPGETLAQWDATVESALALGVGHVSAYSLIVEDGTKMARQVASGELPGPDPDLEADKYLLLDEKLRSAGLSWYEISNFAASIEDRSVHNLAYWRDWDWWGFGPGAHSHIGERRWWNVKHPRAYAGRLAAGSSPGAAGETLTAKERVIERVMLGIRTVEGLSWSAVPAGDDVIELLAEDGLLEADWPRRLRLTLRGRLLADLVTRRLLGWM